MSSRRVNVFMEAVLSLMKVLDETAKIHPSISGDEDRGIPHPVPGSKRTSAASEAIQFNVGRLDSSNSTFKMPLGRDPHPELFND
jgi:hypothetical protein